MLKSIGSNWARLAVSIGVTFVLQRIFYRALGPVGNGEWGVINSIVGMLLLLLVGVPMTSVKMFASAVAKKDDAELNRAVGVVLGLDVVLASAATLVGGMAFFYYVGVYGGNAAPEWAADGRAGFLILVATTAAGFIGGLPYSLQYAHNDFTVSNAIQASGWLLRLGLTWLLIERGPPLTILASVQLFVTLAEFATCVLVNRRRYPGVRLSFRGFSKQAVREVLGFSVYVLLLNVGNMLAFRVAHQVIGAFRSRPEVTSYNYGIQLMIYVTELILGIGQVVMPLAVKLKTQGKDAETRDLFLKWSRITVTLGLAVGCWLLVFGPEFIGWWIHPDEKILAGLPLQILVPSFFVFFPARGVALPILMGRGEARRPATTLLLMGVLNLVLSLSLVHRFGTAGVALATSIPNVLFAAAIAVMACRELSVPLGRFTGYVFVKPALGALPILGALVAVKLGIGIEGFVPLVLTGLGCVLGFAIVAVLFVFAGDPYVDLRAKLVARFARRAEKASS